MAGGLNGGWAIPEDPDKAWDMLKVKQVVKYIDLEPPEVVPAGHLRFVCVSDTHNRPALDKLEVPPGDVLIHAGDFSDTGKPPEIEKFIAWLQRQPHKHKIVIAGNHDLCFDLASYPKTFARFGHREQFDGAAMKKKLAAVCTYLEDSSTTIEGIKIYGSPWQPTFCDWAFNVERGAPIVEKWNQIEDNVDILVTHGPPIGHGDMCSPGNNRAGCVDLLRLIQTKIKPKYHIFGHIHEGYGVSTDGTTVFVNASTCTFNYRPVNPPVCFDFPAPALGGLSLPSGGGLPVAAAGPV